MSSACQICSSKCFGVDGYDGSCCKLEERDFIIGPISDSGEFLEIQKKIDWVWKNVAQI